MISFLEELQNSQLADPEMLWLLGLVLAFLVFGLFKFSNRKIAIIVRSLAFALLIFACYSVVALKINPHRAADSMPATRADLVGPVG